MTNSPTPAERLALKTAHAALESRDASYDLVSTIVFALGSAGLLMDPEKAQRFAELEAAAGDGSTRTVDEDPIAYALTPVAELVVGLDGATPEALHASSGAVIETPAADDVRPQVQKLRALIAGQREDAHDGLLHHPYRLGRDLPEVRP